MINIRARIERVGTMELDIVRDKLPLIMEKSLNITAKDAQGALVEEMKRVFDRPTQWTLNGFYVKNADRRKNDLTAYIVAKDQASGKKVPPAKYLTDEVYGAAARRQKRFEARLQADGILPQGWVVVPGKGAEIDEFGAMSRTFIVKVMNAIERLYAVRGPRPNSGKRAPKVTAGLDVFASTPYDRARAHNGGNLPYGIWQRTGVGQVKCLMFFMPRAKYRTLLKAFDVVEKFADAKFPEVFDRVLTKTIKES